MSVDARFITEFDQLNDPSKAKVIGYWQDSWMYMTTRQLQAIVANLPYPYAAHGGDPNAIPTGYENKTLKEKVMWFNLAVAGVPRETPVVNVSNAQALALGTTAIEIAPAEPGRVLLPKLLIVNKAAGAYAMASVTACILGYGTVADNNPCTTWTNSPAFSIMTNAAAAQDLSQCLVNNGVAAGIPFGIAHVDTIVGKNLAVRTVGASPTGAGGGALKFKLYYDSIDYASYFQLP